MQFGGSSIHEIVKADFSSSTDPVVGVSYSLGLNKFFFTNEAFYLSNKYLASKEYSKSQTNQFGTINTETIIDYEIAVSYIRINSLISLFVTDKVYLKSGITNSFLITKTNLRTEYTYEIRELSWETSETEKTSHSEALSHILKHEIGFLIGTGAVLKNHFLIEANLERGRGFSTNDGSNIFNLETLRTTYNLMIGYKF